MARVVYLVRFFRVVPTVPPLMMAAFIGTTAIASAVAMMYPDRGRSALTPVLMLQLFACSSGFMVPARRGHYDLLLMAGESRFAIAAAHWIMSMLPGIAAWMVVAAAEIVGSAGARRSTIASGTLLAMLLVSTVPWALTVALPRFAGAVGWLVALAVAAAVVEGGLRARVFDMVGGGGSWIEAAAALIVYPPLLVGEHLVGAHGWLAAPALLVSLSAMGYAFSWIEHHDIPLEAAQ